MALTLELARHRDLSPPQTRPRILGSDAVYYKHFVKPFEDAPCAADYPYSAGWGLKPGFPDYKSAWQSIALGYRPCLTKSPKHSTPPSGIMAHAQVAASYALGVSFGA